MARFVHVVAHVVVLCFSCPITCHKSTGRATLAMRWTACSGNGDVACGGCPKLLNVAGVLMMSTLVSCVHCFSIHDLLLVESSQHSCNVVFTGAPGVPDLCSAADTAEGAHVVIFDRAGDSNGGVKDEEGLWLACQSTGNSTCGRAHGPTSMLSFFLFF